MKEDIRSGGILTMRGIKKNFPGVVALKNVDFDLVRGEIHAIIGENGAGKSTLMKILCGVYPYGTYEGEILLKDDLKKFQSPRDAKESGISIVFQEIVVVPDLTVGENIYLGDMPKTRLGLLNWGALHSESTRFLEKLGLDIDSHAIIKTLTVGEQQLVQVAKAISDEPSILILDEPTSSLTDTETDTLFSLIRVFCRAGGTCIYISHKIEEVELISDRITVLRDGEKIGTQNTSAISRSDIIRMIVGREIKEMYPKVSCELGEVIFEVKNLSQRKKEDLQDKKRLSNISLTLQRGEILGISGLLGSGRTELCMGLFGILPDVSSGEFYINGSRTFIGSPKEAIQQGIVLLTENRREYGLIHTMSTLHNISLSSLHRYRRYSILNHESEKAGGFRMVDRLKIKVPSLDTVVENLSGGNQQKVLLARWILTEPKIFILDEPTKGIDVGSKVGIFHIINDLVAAGAGIILVSSELPELLGMCDRILVMREGEIRGEFARPEFSQEHIMHMAMGQ
ncbi:MAG: sugar ABC transporter ATP-binding protein [Spirochaetes bacterium]|nr:sugar ABC transporter ATP-binding protein [Spirochaetota bacterium]